MHKKKKHLPSLLQANGNTAYSGTQILVKSEAGLHGYNITIVSRFRREFGDIAKDLKLVEFGAGTGALAQIWVEKFGISPICIEIDEQLVNLLNTKNFETHLSLKSIEKNIGAIYTSNVLEHIENDTDVLRDFYQHIAPGGKLGIYVPAFSWLFSELDSKVGHVRRYSKYELIRKVEEVGFEVKTCHYADSLGVPASLLLKIFGFNESSGFGSNLSLRVYDKFIYPISRLLDALFFKNVIGKNLFLIAVK
jgi:Methyltransferase domain